MTIDLHVPILILGAGKMGGALLSGLLSRGLSPEHILVQDPSPPSETAELITRHSLRAAAEFSALDQPPSVILAAVKPQVMDEVFGSVTQHVGPATLTISIAAGRSIASFEKHLPPGAAVVRAMPNTPAAIGQGITVCCPNANVTTDQKEAATALMSAVGAVEWIDDERLMDAVTAVSGSGPAYVFHVVECMADAGVAAGLDRELSRRLARATVAGSGALLAQSDLPAEELRRNVTSPGGTTAAALDVLIGEDALKRLFEKAVLAAKKRGQELAGD